MAIKGIPRFIPSLTIKELIKAFRNVGSNFERDWLKEFSHQFADYLGVSYAIPAPSGRAALAAALHALELPKKGEVIIPSLVFHCIPKIFQEFGLKPSFVDINLNTYCMETNQLKEAINSSTVAIFPVHLYGRACNMNAISRIANNHKLVVIEDCAQACGAFYSGRRLGSFGDVAIFSFHHHKNISLLGSGMLTTNSLEIAKKATCWLGSFPIAGKSLLFKHLLYAVGMRFVTMPWVWSNFAAPILKSFSSKNIDLIELFANEPFYGKKSSKPNWFMPRQFQGKIGLIQLEKLDKLNKQRVKKGDKLLESLKDIPGLGLPSQAFCGENIYSSFVVRVKDRQEFRRRLRCFGVDTHGGNMVAANQLPGLEDCNRCDLAAEAIKHMVHLPIYPAMEEVEIFRVVQAIKSILL